MKHMVRKTKELNEEFPNFVFLIVQVVAMILIGFGSTNLLIIAIMFCKLNVRGFFDFLPFWVFFQVITALVDTVFIITSIAYLFIADDSKVLKYYVLPIQTVFLILNLAMLITTIDKLRLLKTLQPQKRIQKEIEMIDIKNAFPRSTLCRSILQNNNLPVNHVCVDCNNLPEVDT